MASIALLGAALGLAVRAKVGRPPPFEPPAREPPGEAPQLARRRAQGVRHERAGRLRRSLAVLHQAVRWFPKLTVIAGGRTWSYDGAVERTVDAIVENAAGGPALRTLDDVGGVPARDGRRGRRAARFDGRDGLHARGVRLLLPQLQPLLPRPHRRQVGRRAPRRALGVARHASARRGRTRCSRRCPSSSSRSRAA